MFFNKMHRLCAQFAGASGGNIALIFALALIPIIASVGAAVDYSRMSDTHTKLLQAADAAAIAALRVGSNESSIDTATKVFNANLASSIGQSQNVEIEKLDVTVASDKSQANVICQARIRMTLTMAILDAWRPVSCNSTAVQGTMGATELTVVLDNSASMTRPLDPAQPPPIDPATGCAFACHVSAADVRARGVKTKMDEGIEALRQLSAKIDNNSNTTYRIFTISEKLKQELGPTTSKSAFSNALDTINFDTSTHIGDEMSKLVNRVKKPKKGATGAVVLVTDGLEEHRNADYVPPAQIAADPAGDQVWLGAFDGVGYPVPGLAMPGGGPAPVGFLKACRDIKAKGLDIYVLYMPHDSAPTQWEPSHQTNEPASRAALSKCASPGKLIVAEDHTKIAQATALLLGSFSTPLRIAR